MAGNVTEWEMEECLLDVAYRQWVFSLPTRLPVFKPARGPPVHAAGEPATRSQVPLHFEEGFFADPDSISFELCREDATDRYYSEFDCAGNEPQYTQGCNFVPLHVVCGTCWCRGASELQEDEGKKKE